MDYDINKNTPAFAFSIDGKKYVLKVGLVGHYELFAFGHHPKERPGADLKIFYSRKELEEWRESIKK